MPLLFLQDIHLTLRAAPLLAGAELLVEPRDRLCLVGRNGSGKSTLLKIAAGQLEPEEGSRFIEPRATVRYLPQEPDLSGFATTRDYVEAGLAAGDDPNRAYYLLGSLGLSGDEPTATLSGGEARRAALAHTLAPQPDILLLDEPTNHLDMPAIEWLEQELAQLRSAIVLISHDRRFLSRLSRATIWLDRGKTRRLEQGFAAFEMWRDERLEQEEQEQHKLVRKIAREEDWIRYGVSGRRKRNQRRVAELSALRQKHAGHKIVQGALKMTMSETETSALVIKAEGVSKTYSGTPIVEDFSIRIQRGDRIGIVGPNGAGKTTLINLLTGRLAPDTGKLSLSPTLVIALLDQSRASLDPKTSVKETLTGGHGDTVQLGSGTRHVMSYMKDFLFEPEQAGTEVRLLSGGERARLLLARALAQASNLLVLDEPTNDLDLETLDLLQEMIADYPGTVLLVSHDRDFLDRVTTSILMAEGKGHFAEYAGGYSDMVVQRGEGVTARTASKAVPEKFVPPPKAEIAPKRKMSFKDKHRLERLPGEIACFEAEIKILQLRLADPGLYARDAKQFTELSARLTHAETAHAAAEIEWLELELLRETLEG